MSDTNQYIVSARKYRPATFSSVIGQKNLTSTLVNAIGSGRLAQAYLFCGPRGVGKTSCARIFAKTINCLNPGPGGEACGECESCKAITRGNSFNLIELDAASNNSVDDIRNLIEQVNVPPQIGKYKVFIIDEVHMLSSAAFNAFLKTLEEPPRYAIFILATTEKQKVIPTILSRCQIYDFKRITVEDMVAHLAEVAKAEGIEADSKALGVIARKADGAMRDALSIFDQVAASSAGHVTYEAAIENLNVLDYDFYFRLVDAFRKGDVADALLIYKEIRDRGFDSLFFINGLSQHLRDLMVAADKRTLPLLEVDSDTAGIYNSQASSLPLQWYYAAMKILNDADYAYRNTTNKQLLVEVSLIRLCQLLKPATPPFDLAEGSIPLRNPSVKTAAPQHGASEAPKADRVCESQPEYPAASASRPAPAMTAAPTPRPASPELKRPAAAQRPTRGHSFSLSGAFGKSGNVDTTVRQEREFTDDEFYTAWGVFQSQHQELHILMSAMRSAHLERIDRNRFKVLVNHPQLLQSFSSEMTGLVSFLREALGNDLVAIEVELDKDVELEKKLSPQDFLKKIFSDNPALAEFMKDINAELD